MTQVISARLSGSVRCRQIGPADLEAIANLLREGFPSRSAARWRAALDRLGAHVPPDGFPQYGYMLESGASAVGVLLAISASMRDATQGFVRCNMSCWYVRPDFRPYAPLLSARATKDRSATYINVSPAPTTWPIIEAQGFRRLCNGAFAAVPMLARRSHSCTVTTIGAPGLAPPSLAPDEWRILQDHAKYGCISVCCETPERAYPFVFRRRLFKRHPLPCAQLVYCADPADLARFARSLGWFLARRGMPWILVGADGPVADLPGKYFDDKLPMYFMGQKRPRPGDLAYTEAAMFGL